MNDFVIELLWSVVRVTLVLLAGCLLYLTAGRQRPEVGARIASGCLLAGAVLSLLAWLPLPSWWSWGGILDPAATRSNLTSTTDARPHSEHTAPDADAQTHVVGDPQGPGWASRLWNRLAGVEGRRRSAEPYRSWPWATIAAAFLVAASAWGLARLLLGVMALRRWRTRSRPVEDVCLHGLTEMLCGQMGCQRRIEVRESPDLDTAATVGFGKPLLLLPLAWRTWSAAELRAVLAHEIAHIRRADYAAWLLARLSVALHFYHPLAHWLASRLQLQQELAADALGARHAGGRPAYLRALAGLALRQETQSLFAPARAFLPARGTLMRRIQMLRNKEDVRPLSRLGSALTAVALAVSLLAVSAVRGPAHTPADDGGPAPEQPAEAKDAGLELFYVPSGLSGVWAVRPNELFKLPGMKERAAKLNREAAENCRAIGIAGLPLLEDIELATGGVIFRTDRKQPKGQRHLLMLSFLAVRTVRDYDWKGLMQSMARKTTKTTYAGRIYFKSAEPSNLLISLGPDQCFYFPDGRTLIMDSEKNLRAWFDAGCRPSLAPVGAEDWKEVHGGLFAVALDNRHGKDLGSDEAPPPAVARLLENTSQLVFGLSGRDELRFDVYARWPEGSSNEKLAEAGEATAALLKESMKGPGSNDAEGKEQQAIRALWGKVLKAGSVERKKDTVHAHSAVKMTLLEAIQLLQGF